MADEYQVSSTSGSRVSGPVLPAAFAFAVRFGFVARDEHVAALVVPRGNLVAPPQLARDAPVLDVLEPLVVDREPLLGEDLHVAARDGVERDLRDRLARMQRAGRRRLAHRHVPLLGQRRLDDFAGAAAARHHHLVRLLRDDEAGGAQVLEHALARDVAVEPAVLRRRVVVDGRGQREDRDRLEVVALADFEVVEVVRRRDLHATGAELAVDHRVGDHRNRPAGQRQRDLLADERGVALVLGVHGHGDVAQQGLGARRRHDDARMWIMSSVHRRIADLPQAAVFLLGFDLEVGHGRLQLRVPVDEPLAAVDQALFVQLHEGLDHHAGQLLVHREVGAAPVDRIAKPAHLPEDRSAREFLPLPDLRVERVAADRRAARALRLELALDDDLRGDPRVIGARQPQRVEARHPVVARQRVHDGVVEAVTHVQQAGDVRRRQLDRERRPGRIGAGVEVAARFPYRRPPRLDGSGFKALGEFGAGGSVRGRHEGSAEGGVGKPQF